MFKNAFIYLIRLSIFMVSLQDLLLSAHDPLSEKLDKQFGANVTDHKIFSNLTQYWENEYHEDMKSLNVSFQLFVD